MSDESDKDLQFEERTVKLLTQNKVELQQEATRQGLDFTDALNQAVRLWIEMSKDDMIGKRIYVSAQRWRWFRWLKRGFTAYPPNGKKDN